MNDSTNNVFTRKTVNCMAESVDALTDTIAGPWKDKLKTKSAECQNLWAVK